MGKGRRALQKPDGIEKRWAPDRKRRLAAALTAGLLLTAGLSACGDRGAEPNASAPIEKKKPELVYDWGGWTLDALSRQVYADIAHMGPTTLTDVPWQLGYAGDDKLILFNGRYIFSFTFAEQGGKLDCVDLLGNFDALSNEAGSSVHFDFSPQGNCVVLETRRQENDALIPARFLYDFDAKELFFLYDDSHTDEAQTTSWSPDGKIYAVLYRGGGGLWVYHVEEKKLYTAALSVEQGEEPPRLLVADNGDICVQETLPDGSAKNRLLCKDTGYAEEALAIAGQVVWFGGQDMLVLQYTRLERYSLSGELLETSEYGLQYVGRNANMVLFKRGRSLVGLHDISGEIASYEGVLDRPLTMIEKSGHALLYRTGEEYELVNASGDVLKTRFPDAEQMYLCDEPVPINADTLVRVVMAPASRNLGQFYIEKSTRLGSGVSAAFDPLSLTKEQALPNNQLDTQYQAVETQWIPGEYASLSKQGVDVAYLYWNQQYTGVFRYLQTPSRDESTYWSVVEERAEADFDPFAPTTAPDYVLLSYRDKELMLPVDGVVDDLKTIDIDGDGLEEWVLATSTGGVFLSPTRMQVIPMLDTIAEVVDVRVSADGTFATVTGLGTALRFHAAAGRDFRKEPPCIRPGEYVFSDNGIFQRFYVCYGVARTAVEPLGDPAASASAAALAAPQASAASGADHALVRGMASLEKAGNFLIRYRAEGEGLRMKVLQKEK